MLNIPIYRARKKDSDEWVEGALIANAFVKNKTKEPTAVIFDNQKMNYDCYQDIGEQLDDFEIDPNTLAIHFPNMTDKNGKKIFASLSEDGVGGDDLNWDDLDMTAKFSKEDNAFILYGLGAGFMTKEYCKNFEVIGIHKG